MISFRFARALLAALSLAALTACVGPAQRPTADFRWCPDGSEGELDFLFFSTSRSVDGRDLVGATWEFGDGTTCEGLGPVEHRFLEAGSYAVTLTVTDRRGVSGTATRIVDVDFAAFIDPTWSLTLGYPGYPPCVSGVVGNRSSARLNEVVVRVRFYDADGVRLEEERCVIPDLEPGERARIRVAAADFAPRVFHATVVVESFSADCQSAGAAGG